MHASNSHRTALPPATVEPEQAATTVMATRPAGIIQIATERLRSNTRTGSNRSFGNVTSAMRYFYLNSRLHPSANASRPHTQPCPAAAPW